MQAKERLFRPIAFLAVSARCGQSKGTSIWNRQDPCWHPTDHLWCSNMDYIKRIGIDSDIIVLNQLARIGLWAITSDLFPNVFCCSHSALRILKLNLNSSFALKPKLHFDRLVKQPETAAAQDPNCFVTLWGWCWVVLDYWSSEPQNERQSIYLLLQDCL